MSSGLRMVNYVLNEQELHLVSDMEMFTMVGIRNIFACSYWGSFLLTFNTLGSRMINLQKFIKNKIK